MASPVSLTPVLDSLSSRASPLSAVELETLAVEIATASKTERQHTGFLRRVERSGLVAPDLMEALRARAQFFETHLQHKGLEKFSGFIGIDHEGHAIDPRKLTFQGIGRASGTMVYVSDRFEKVAEKILKEADGEFKTYFRIGNNSTLTKTLALSQVVIDHEAEDLKDFGVNSENERTLFGWELLARVDFEMNGADPQARLGSSVLFSRYEALKGFVNAAGLHPMSQRALAIRDGRDKAVAFFEGQGADYLSELKNLLDTEPVARALFNEAKPLFAKYNIDLDHLLTLVGADPSQIENYFGVYGVTTSMPVSSLVQVMRVAVMEQYGYDFFQFAGVTGQSGGLPAAYFAAGSFERNGYQPPAIPKFDPSSGVFGYRSLESYRNFFEWMLFEGIQQQRGTEPHYSASVKQMVSLKSWLSDKKEVTAEDIDAYFGQYRLVNMAISGIPYASIDTPAITRQVLSQVPSPLEGEGQGEGGSIPVSPLGKILFAINNKFQARGSYVFMSNHNTRDVPGKRGSFILVAGRGEALAELAKMIVLKKADGYPEDIQQIVASFGENVGVPITNTRVSLAPHDPKGLRPSYETHKGWAGQKGISLSVPRVDVIDDWEDIGDGKPALEGDELVSQSRDFTDDLLRQQYLVPVSVPYMAMRAAMLGATSLIGIGPGSYLPGTALPTNMGATPVHILGMEGQDHEGIAGRTRLTTTNPQMAFASTLPPPVGAAETALDELKKIPQLTVTGELPDLDHGTGLDQSITVRINEPLSDADFENFKKHLRNLPGMNPLFGLLDAAKIEVDGVVADNPMARLILNKPNLEYAFSADPQRESITITERGFKRIVVQRISGSDDVGGGHVKVIGLTGEVENEVIIISEFTESGAKLVRYYMLTSDIGGAWHYKQILQGHDGIYSYRLETRKAYAKDWDIPPSALELPVTETTVDTQEVTEKRLKNFAIASGSRNVRFIQGSEAHPNFIIDLMWKGMLSPTFSNELDLDFTRVIDEGKQIEMGVPIHAGDTITTKARVVHAEDFKKGDYEGRRVVVYASAKNQKGEVVGRVVSTMVSRFQTGLLDGQSRVIYTKTLARSDGEAVVGAKPQLDFFANKRVFTLEKPVLVAKGSLQIPQTLADTYADVDRNRIHLSDLSAALAELPKGRILQGLGTLAYVNEQVVRQLRLGGQARGYKGIANLAFSGYVYPGDELTYEITRVAHAEGNHRYHVSVKKIRISPDGIRSSGGDALNYDIVMQGPKTAVIVTGQGSQYVGMGDHLASNPEYKDLLALLQSWIPNGDDGKPMVDLMKELNAGTQDTSKAQPMIFSYDIVLGIDLIWKGLIPDDAIFTGHSLGMWGAYVLSLVQSEKNRFTALGTTFNTKLDFLKALEPVLRPVMTGVCMRGAVMQKYVDPANPQGMIQVEATDASGPLTDEMVKLLQDFINQDEDSAQGIKRRYLGVANYNMRKLTIMGGHEAALQMAAPVLEAWGFRVKRVNVKNAFHTELMRVASDDFGRWMAEHGSPFAVRPDMQLYMDTLAQPLSEIGEGGQQALAAVLQAQISTSVRWHETIARLIDDGVTRFMEIGPSGRYDKKSEKVVGFNQGQLGLMARQEVVELVHEGRLGSSDEITNVFANPLLVADFGGVTFSADGPVSEYDRPRVVKAVPVRPAPIQAEMPTGVVPPAAPQPAVAQPVMAAVSSDQVNAVIAGFLSTHQAALEATDANLDSLAQQLAGQLATLGGGARGPLSVLASQLASPETAVAAGPSIEERIIEVIFGKGIAPAGKKAGTTSATKIKSDLNIGSSDQVGFYEEVGKALGVNPATSAFESLGGDPTISAVAEVFRKAGAKDGVGATAAPSKTDQLKAKAVNLALAQLPAGPAMGVAAVAVAPVSADEVQRIFFNFNQEFEGQLGQGNTDAHVSTLASRYEALGPGAISPLQARLSALQGTGAEAQAAPAGPPVEDRIIEVIFGKGIAPAGKKAGTTSATKIKSDLNIGSSDQVGFYEEVGKALGVNPATSAFESLGGDPTISAVAEVFRKAGAKDGAGASQAPAISPRDDLDRRAIEMVLPRLMAQMPQGGGMMVAVADPAVAQRVAALEARIAELEAGRGVSLVGSVADTPVVLQPDGSVEDPREVELQNLRRVLENVRAGTSDHFVDELMQPHFDPSKIYIFAQVERNGGRSNLMDFYADLRMGRLPKSSYDRQARIHQLANQLDAISLSWLENFIRREREAGREKNALVLESVHEKASVGLASGKIVTFKVITVRSGRHIPDYGSPQKTNFVPSNAGTRQIASDLTRPDIADPKSKEDMDWLIKSGADLRGVRVLVHEAGTMSAPLIAKLLQLGADVVVTNYATRSRLRPDGELQNDFFWHLYNDNAARGARLTVLPNMQPGNPHDEKLLLEYFKGLADKFTRFEDLDPDSDKNWHQQKETIESLPADSFRLALQKRIPAIEQQRYHQKKKIEQMQAEGSSAESIELEKSKLKEMIIHLTDAETREAIRRIIPQIYINGAAKVKYDDVTKRGDPYTPLSVFVLASRHIALNLAKMHQKYATGDRVVFLNFTSPNDGTNVADNEGELLGSVLPGSGYYELSKAALAAGHTAAVAKANGLVDAKGKSLLVEVARRTGWGKSDGRGPTLMAENDFFSEEVEKRARELGINLRTLTGDELATLQLSGVLAVLTGQRKGEFFEYDDTYGFTDAARTGKLGEIFLASRASEVEKHSAAKPAWEVAHPKTNGHVQLPNDGSIIDLNKLNIAIAGVPAGHPYAVQPGDILFGDDTPVVTGFGMVGPLGPDALTNYRGMLARGHYQGNEGEGDSWLGMVDYYNLARSVGVDVSGWNVESMAEQIGIKLPEPAENAEPAEKLRVAAENLARGKGNWGKAFGDWLLKNSGIQQMDEFVEFEMERDFKAPEDVQIDLTDTAMIQKMALAGHSLFRRADGTTYALVKKGETVRIPLKMRMPVTIVGQLPGANYRGFNFAGFGAGRSRDAAPEAHGAQMAKMITGQILMTMGGRSPADLQKEFGPENMNVALGGGLGDLKPLNRMTLDPVMKGDTLPNNLVAAFLSDSWSGEVSTEMLGAKGAPIANTAACSTGKSNVDLALKGTFARYYLATKAKGSVDWPKVFSQFWLAGGLDYAVTFNAIFGFMGVGALITDDWRKARDIAVGVASRPDDKERAGFVTSTGGGAVSIEPLGHAKRHGTPVYSMFLGSAFRTDGDKLKTGGAREGYGIGQRDAIFEAWDQAKIHLTQPRFTPEQVWDGLVHIYSRILKKEIDDERLSSPVIKFRKKSEQVAFLQQIEKEFGVKITWEEVARAESAESFADHVSEQTRTLKKNVKFIVVAHKTSTGAGDPYEEESLRLFLEKVLPPGEFANIMKTKAHLGHLLGGSSGADTALTSLVLRYRALIGNPGLDNVSDEAGANPTLWHNREAVALDELYDPDTIYVVLGEAAGFGAKNTSTFETRGKIHFDSDDEALSYTKGLVESYARERTQKRAERLNLRGMAFYADAYPEIPMSNFEDLYALYLRSDAISRALFSGKKFKFDNILSWIYQYPINKEHKASLGRVAIDLGDQVDKFNAEERRVAVIADKGEKERATQALKVAKEAFASPESLNRYNAIKYSEAYDSIVEILSELEKERTPDGENMLKAIEREAKARGWDKQTVVFYGISDGMGLRTLLALIASGAVKEVVGVHYDLPTNNPNNWATKLSSYTPEILKAYAASKGVKLTTFNENGILYATRPDAAKGIVPGDELPLQEHIAKAIEEARGRAEVKDILFWDYVAFALLDRPRRPGDAAIQVPTIDATGSLSYADVLPAKSQQEAVVGTLNTMGYNHDRLLKIFLQRGWLGKQSVTFTADWWGSESEDMLYGVYGGANLGDAKLIQKKLLKEFAEQHPASGKHAYLGYPAFMSFALHVIPGGTVTGLIALRIYEDIANGVDIEGIDASALKEIRGYSMEQLAIRATYKAVMGQYREGYGNIQNKIAMDKYEKAIAREIDRRFKLVAEQVRAVVEAKGDRFAKLSPEESYAILKDYVTDDYLKYCYQHIPTVRERHIHARKLKQAKDGIERLPLPQALQSTYPFFARAISKSVNTPELAIAVIDAGGVGTLMADDLSAEALHEQIVAVKKAVGDDAPLVVNIMMTHTGREAQIEQLFKDKPAAVSFGNGYVTTDIVEKLHKAGILVIQLVGTVEGVKSLIDKKVDLVIAERNYGPGHISRGKGSEPEKLIRAIRQELYDADIPIIAGGGFVSADDVADAFHWGASAVQLDDVVAYSRESTYPGKGLFGMEYSATGDDEMAPMVPVVNPSIPVIELEDEEGKPIRFLNTPGAQKVASELSTLRARGFDAKRIAPFVAMIIRRGLDDANRVDMEYVFRGLFFASERIGQVRVGEGLESAFARLSGKPTPPTGGGSGGGGGRPVASADGGDPSAPVLPTPSALPGVAAELGTEPAAADLRAPTVEERVTARGVLMALGYQQTSRPLEYISHDGQVRIRIAISGDQLVGVDIHHPDNIRFRVSKWQTPGHVILVLALRGINVSKVENWQIYAIHDDVEGIISIEGANLMHPAEGTGALIPNWESLIDEAVVKAVKEEAARQPRPTPPPFSASRAPTPAAPSTGHGERVESMPRVDGQGSPDGDGKGAGDGGPTQAMGSDVIIAGGSMGGIDPLPSAPDAVVQGVTYVVVGNNVRVVRPDVAEARTSPVRLVGSDAKPGIRLVAGDSADNSDEEPAKHGKGKAKKPSAARPGAPVRIGPGVYRAPTGAQLLLLRGGR